MADVLLTQQRAAPTAGQADVWLLPPEQNQSDIWIAQSATQQAAGNADVFLGGMPTQIKPAVPGIPNNIFVTDTALGLSDSVLNLFLTRAITDTALSSFSDSVVQTKALTKSETDTGLLSFSDSVTQTKSLIKSETDTGISSFSDSIVRTILRPDIDTGLSSFSDAVVQTKALIKSETDTGLLSFTDVVVQTKSLIKSETDTALSSFSDSVPPAHATRIVTDTALTSSVYVDSGTYNTAEGGTLGVNPTTGNSGGASGVAWSGTGGATLITYANDQAHRGSQSYKFVCPAGTSSNYLFWSLGSPTTSQQFGVGYFVFGNAPSVTYNVFRFLDSSANQCAQLVLLTGSNTFRARNAANASIGSASSAVPTNQWVRIEWRLIPSATVGELEIRAWWTNPDGTGTPDWTSNNTGQVLGADLQTVRQGEGVSITHVSTDTMWMDDLGAWGSTWFGPSILSFDSIAVTKNRNVSDTALSSFSDSLVHSVARPDSDNALVSFSDSVIQTKSLIKSEADNALVSFSDSVVHLIGRPKTDTALSFSDAVAQTIIRNIAETDTALSFSDLSKLSVSRSKTDIALTLSDTLTRAIQRLESDTGLSSFTDSVNATFTPGGSGTVAFTPSDIALLFSDSVTSNIIRSESITDVALILSDGVTRYVGRIITDGVLQEPSPSLSPSLTLLLGDGPAFTDSVATSVTKLRVDVGSGNEISTTYKSLVIGKAVISSHDVHEINEDSVQPPKVIYTLTDGKIHFWVSGKGKSAVYL